MATFTSGKWDERSVWLFRHMNHEWLLDLTALFETVQKALIAEMSSDVEYVLQSDILGIFYKKQVIWYKGICIP
jgi:hypothetical protein